MRKTTQYRMAARRKWAIWIAAALALSAVVVLALASRHSASIQERSLIGRWYRPDGGYVLEIQALHPDGRLEAAYRNPRPINVARAAWRKRDGEISVFVELRDINYPGSTYNLRYIPEIERLAGEYFQALEGRTYPVEFYRVRQGK